MRWRRNPRAEGGVDIIDPTEAPVRQRRWFIWIAVGIACAICVVLWAMQPREQKPFDPGPAPDGMVWIPAGTFWMGSSDPKMTDAQPEHAVTLDGFWMDATEVTNEQFEKFVAATGYKTTAELTAAREEGAGDVPETRRPGSMVFLTPEQFKSTDTQVLWWRFVAGADWRHPEGPESNLTGRERHPVVHVTWTDADAYAWWAGKLLPTEAQWEYAARGGLDRATFAWGNKLKQGERWRANLWQGEFPAYNSGDDGFKRTAPVGSYPANAYGLRDMAGNVWEWCQDWYKPDYYQESPERNPVGPPGSFEPSDPAAPRRVQRGGSFLSLANSPHPDFAAGARSRGDPNAAACHLGFRCVKSP